MKLLVGITGASGSVLAKGLLEYLWDRGHSLHIVITDTGRQVFRYETGLEFADFLAQGRMRGANLVEQDNQNLFAPVASGSYGVDCMVIVPCSMATAGKIATVSGDSLLTRAADVCLKERTRLVLVPRETPLHSGHLRSLLTLSELGAWIVPPMPMFYARPKSLDEMVDGMVGRILNCCGIPNTLYEKWGNQDEHS